MKTAQILIVGNEILAGRTADINSHFIAQELHKKGVVVTRISVLPDDLGILSDWIRCHHALTDSIFICGGIGGTPDDLTREAVARAVGVELKRHPEAFSILKNFYKERANEERMSMADLPDGCELISNPVTQAPGFKIKNIFVFAGVPQILRAMFENIKGQIQGETRFENEIFLSVGEGDVARFMKQLNSEFPLLDLGSYPTMEPERGYKTQLVFKSSDEKTVAHSVARFKELAGEGIYASPKIQK